MVIAVIKVSKRKSVKFFQEGLRVIHLLLSGFLQTIQLLIVKALKLFLKLLQNSLICLDYSVNGLFLGKCFMKITNIFI